MAPTTTPTAPTGNNGSPSKAPPALPRGISSDLSLIHRVMLADPCEYKSLTLSGRPRMLSTPSYEEFVTSLEESSSDPSNLESMTNTMKKAFLDQLCERIQREGSLQPAQDLVLELHQQLRALIPSRKDLHTLLQDEDISKAQLVSNLLAMTIKAAKALSMLESEARAESTQAWVATALLKQESLQQEDEHHQQEQTPDSAAVSFLISSLLYLLYKTELCANDKQEFYFSQLWLPALVRQGADLEREAFETLHGPLKDSSTAPATRAWLKEAYDNNNDQQPSAPDAKTDENFKRMIRTSWVRDILFRSSENTASLAWPEVFHLDQPFFQGLRLRIRMAVAGSALSLYASQASQINSAEVLNVPVLDPQLELRRAALTNAMGARGKPEDLYRNDIVQAAVQLARHWRPTLDESASESLRNRTLGVLSGQDPVLQLLETRMKACFLELIHFVDKEASGVVAPAQMQSGIQGQAQQKQNRKQTFLVKANVLFCSKGLSFFSSDLALASWNALRVVETAVRIYGTALLEPELSRLATSSSSS